MAFFKQLTRLGHTQRRIRKNRRRSMPRLTKERGGSWYWGHYAPNPNPDGFAPAECWGNNQAYYNYAKERARRRATSQRKVSGRRSERARLKQELRDVDMD